MKRSTIKRKSYRSASRGGAHHPIVRATRNVDGRSIEGACSGRGSSQHGGLAERPIASVPKTDRGNSHRGSNPRPSAIIRKRSQVADGTRLLSEQGSLPRTFESCRFRHSPMSRGSRIKRTKCLRPIGKRGRGDRAAIAKLRPLVLARDGHVCARCRDPRSKPLDLHHRLARSQGGKHTVANLVALCRACHVSVTEHAAKDWRKWVVTRKAGAA